MNIRVTIMAVFLLAACASGAGKGSEDDAGIPVREIQAGQCIVPTDNDFWLSRVQLQNCDEPHRMEVAGDYDLADGDYPGNSALLRDSYNDCQPIFEQYVGIPFWDSVYDLRTITPTPSSWRQGDRSVVCLVVEVNGNELTEPAENARR